MDKAVLQMLGYITEAQWIDAYKNADGVVYKKNEIKQMCIKTHSTYNIAIPDKIAKVMNIK